jgi:hypothetical protein
MTIIGENDQNVIIKLVQSQSFIHSYCYIVTSYICSMQCVKELAILTAASIVCEQIKPLDE